MFERGENGKIRFKKLDFECYVADAIYETPPADMEELKWMVARMVDSIQVVAYEYTQDELVEEEWEDVFYAAEPC